MSFASVSAALATPLSTDLIQVEADIAKGLHSFAIVGLPSKAIEEARFRVSSAIKFSGFKSPKAKNHKITISLSPADVKKEGTLFDLPIALAYLIAAEELKQTKKDTLFIGELSLDGSVRAVHGVLPIVELAKQKGISHIFVPEENAREAALSPEINIYPVSSLKEVVEHLKEIKLITPTSQTTLSEEEASLENDFAFIQGQELGKRALEIAASGGHHVALYGPPGTGKTMLAKAFATILPKLSLADLLEINSLYSVSGNAGKTFLQNPPIRSPHHSTSYAALVGGGTTVRLGEISLAHKGVLFLDEFPEFDRRSIEALRQPLEEGFVSIARASGRARFPARFVLIAAMNPCPCGYKGSKEKTCSCREADLIRYKRKLSGPIVDRIDLWAPVEHVTYEKLTEKGNGETSKRMKERVGKARAMQKERFAGTELRTNADIPSKDIVRFTAIEEGAKQLAEESGKRLQLSPRAYYKILRLARTIADLEESVSVKEKHILEALQYRPKSLGE